MLADILEFLLYKGWVDGEGNHLEKSQVYDTSSHMSITYWILGKRKFSYSQVGEIALNFDRNTFKIWADEESE